MREVTLPSLRKYYSEILRAESQLTSCLAALFYLQSNIERGAEEKLPPSLLHYFAHLGAGVDQEQNIIFLFANCALLPGGACIVPYILTSALSSGETLMISNLNRKYLKN